MAEYSENIPTKPGFYVYRLWAADGTCLYVGCCGERGPRRVRDRFGSHRHRQPWWPEVARTDVAVFASPAEIVAEERSQIALVKPVHNKRLLGHCGKGHDLTGPGARRPNGACTECTRDYKKQWNAESYSDPETGRREAILAQGRRPEKLAQMRDYQHRPSVRARENLLRRRRSRRSAPGQEGLWA
jgi:hypothetical protein